VATRRAGILAGATMLWLGKVFHLLTFSLLSSV
jgi:hypothetical protein